ncbi:MAG: enoyl-CoA hydratase [Caulobacterales bacterium]
MSPQILVRTEARDGGLVGFVTIDNQRRLNCLGSPLLEAFAGAVRKLADEAGLRVIVVTGAGERAFAGGADIDELAALSGPEAARAFITRVHLACAAVRDAPVPVIARINGYALGAGLELAAACDMRIAADTAVFGMPEVKLGIPSVVEAALLPGLVGWGRTREILLTGETFGAAEALDWRLVEKVVPARELDAGVEGWIAAILSAKPRALALQKALIRQWEEAPMSEAIVAGVNSLAAAFETDEPARAMAQFKADQARRGR